LLCRLLYPFFNSPLDHLFSDPLRHWENGANFLHPTIMGSADPLMYQFWIFVLRSLTRESAPAVLLGCGLLCAAMPYGWYRALREVTSRRRALFGAILIGMVPESISLYAYFMNETLLLTLLGFCFWLTLRSRRKATAAAFILAVVAWTCAALTRTVAVPMALGCVAWLWSSQPQRLIKLIGAIAVAAALVIPAGLHGRAKLRYFAPLGNLYFNEIYHASGMRDIAVDYGPDGRYRFGSPSFYNPTFSPFSHWTTDRSGVAAIDIDLTQGRAPWIAEKQRVAQQRTFPAWRQRIEDCAYLFFAQSWPNSDPASLFGRLTVWTRWIWAPLVLFVTWGTLTRRYRGTAYLVPLCALGTIALLLLQNEGVMEARFREPLDAILVCSALLMRLRREPARP
ncbi:MAG: glycosyltransferase family 39 protein, partial [Steroidobacteraceae bacterium]